MVVYRNRVGNSKNGPKQRGASKEDQAQALTGPGGLLQTDRLASCWTVCPCVMCTAEPEAATVCDS